jgi:glycosyltransferase involved in cell wall biosynthesis
LITAIKSLIDTGRIPPDAIRLNLIGHVPVHDPRLGDLLADPVVKPVVHIESWVPHEAALEQLSRSDVLLLLQPGLQLAIPLKLFEYAAIGRPILALAELDGGVARVIRDSRLGVTVDNNDVDGIMREIDRLVREFRQGSLRAEYTRADVDEYSVENLAAKLAGFLRQAGERSAAERRLA